MRRQLFFVSLLLVLCLAGPAAAQDGNRYDPLKRFSQVMDMVETYYVRDVNRKELVDGAVKGMLQELDPHSAYMDKEAFSEMQVQTTGEFSGIGIEISMKNGRLVVVSPIEDSPAHRAGLKSGDVILEIDEVSTQDMSLMDAVKMIRGPKGSEVVLTILHRNTKTPERVVIVRDTIAIDSVKSHILEPGYLYLRLTKFNEHTTEEMQDAIADARKKGPLDGIVLDLRDNPGGLLDQAVDVSDAFLAEGKIVYIQGRSESSRKDFVARAQSTDLDTNLVVLINAGSASASEIVAGALQDHNRALVIGEPTFGKGSVQTIIPLSDGGGMKLTTALYYTPNGRSIQAEGIKPDLLIPMSTENEWDAFTMRESYLSRHLQNGNTKQEEGKYTKEVQTLMENDNQLRIALKFVKNLPAMKAFY
ncbi:peptidase S41 [Oceanidesulfovibrio indonesiensis]|uniref:Peptidase S41 n=1 Tax=Oceanidesulfovibrio indonesiensis TaxID=54767 RepID=A0A7M3MFQ7_9BACT|nr:S41 family peptidase [Oceanidesulfovibrio indonesiensis]TVM17353.1 peptidase S41 [Oceanidesulfovibrio indonesiensis]